MTRGSRRANDKSPNEPMMLRITAPHFCAGIVRGGACAPILAYMKGWKFRHIRMYCKAKGWQMEIFE